MRKPSILAIFIIIIVSSAIYANTLFNGFVYDDSAQVLDNLWITDFSYFSEIFTSAVWSFRGYNPALHYYRPMMHTIYAFEYHLFTFNPFFWHLVNILIHAFNAVMVFVLASVLLVKGGRSLREISVCVGRGAVDRYERSNGLRGRLKDFPILPFIAALFFVVHPVMTESVAWVAAIPELSYTAFFLLALYLYIRASSTQDNGEGNGSGTNDNDRSALSFLLKPAYIFSIIFFFVALFCKEPAMMLLPVLIAYDYVTGRRPFTLPSLVKYLPFVVLAVIYLFMRNYALGGLSPKFTEHSYLSGFQNILNAGPLVFRYVLNLVLPMKFSPFYVFYPVFSLFEMTALLSWVLVAVCAALYLYLFKKRGISFFAATLIIAPLLPVLYIPFISITVFSVRYLYLPVAGFTIIMALVLRGLFVRYRESAGVSPRVLALTALILVILFCAASFKTITRNMVWKNAFSLWSETIKLYPKNYHAHMNLATYYSDSGQVELAKEAYKTSIALMLELLHPRALPLAENWYNLGLLEFDSGEVERAIESYKESLRIKVTPELTRDVLNNLGNAYATAGFIDEAIMSYERALVIDPNDKYVRHNLEAVRKWKKR